MISASVAELKNDVGRYLNEVLAGEEVVIKDHDAVVAKIIPFNDEPDDALTDEELEAHVLQLAAEGKIRLGKGPVPPEFFDEPLADFGDVDLVRFISEDRDED